MRIFRKRFVPNEVVDISGDEVLYRDEKKLVTRWKPIKPRKDLGGGISCVYFDKGIKVSKFFDERGNFKFWYCDIIKYEYNAEQDEYLIIDLLLDVVVYTDGHYEVLDEEELEEALKKGVITKELADEAKAKLKDLLELIEKGRFKEVEIDR